MNLWWSSDGAFKSVEQGNVYLNCMKHMFFPCVSTSPLSVPLWKASSSPMLVWQMATLGHKWSRVWKSGFNHISTPFRWFECPNRCETFGSSGVLPCLDSVKHLGFSLEEILTSSYYVIYHQNQISQWRMNSDYVITNLATAVQVTGWPWIQRPNDSICWQGCCCSRTISPLL